MGQFSAPSDAPIKSEDESLDALWPEQQEGVPLKQRLKLLLASSRTLKSETEIAAVSEPPHNIYARSYINHFYSQEEKVGCLKVQQNDTGEGNESMCQLIADNNIISGKVDAANSLQQMSPSHLAVITKVSDANLWKKCINFSSGADMETPEKNEIPSDFLDDLDLVVLKERQRMLLSRRAPSFERKTMEDNSLETSSFSEDDLINEGTGVRKGNDEPRDRDFQMAGGHSKTYDLLNFRDHGLTDSCPNEYSLNQATSQRVQGNGFLCSLKKVLSDQGNDLLLKKNLSEHESSHELDLPSDSLGTDIVDVKVEPLNSTELDTRGKHATDNPLYIPPLPIKGDEIPYDSSIDELDHKSLRERLKLFSGNVNAICSSGGDAISASLIKIVPPMINHAIPDSVQGNDLLGSLKKVLSEHESSHELDLPSDSLCADIVEVKVEPLESIELGTRGKHAKDNPLYNFSLPVKREEVPYDCIDELDHMSLRERLHLFSRNANAICSSGGDGIAVSLIKTVPPMVEPTPISSATAKPMKIQISRKRRKTATDSVELAMEEDAPGLLKALLEKGVAVHEIKLYGEPESNEPLDDLSTEDSFAELEEIIIKVCKYDLVIRIILCD
ncbi:unnamed protein product [Cuscuta epithymum]|uniref:Uncharacterized protein n=1 Tax=Cuscuta epithymum TaxID=186058 RepID=A0AAV0CP28_9ASTE|nr:unnamed protein product [Cuscuta epithymum]